MGFMDKAKKLAEQAQQKLDEAQTQFNQGAESAGEQQGGGSSTTSTAVRSRRRLLPSAAAPPPAPPPPPPTEPAPDAPTVPPTLPPSRSLPSPRSRPRSVARAAAPTRPPTRSSRSSSDGALLPRSHARRRHPHGDGHPVRRRTGRSTRTPPCGSCTICSRTAPTASCWPAARGRAATLTDEEKVRLWQLGGGESPGGAPVIAGTGTYDTRHTVELTRAGHRDRRGRRARGHAVLQQAEPARASRPTSRRWRPPPTCR